MNSPYARTREDALTLVRLYEEELAGDYKPEHGRSFMGNALSAYSGLYHARNLCHGLAARSGWWTDLNTGEAIDANDPRVFGQKIALIHSEISEAMEGHRKSLPDDYLPHRRAVEVELADALIRILDTAGAMNLDLAGAMIEKLVFNQQRADHKLENRRAENGKAY